MSKGNRTIAAKIARNRDQIVAGTYSRKSDKYNTPYEMGHHAFRAGEPFNRLWPLHKQQGWKRARDEELRFYLQTGSAGSVARLAKVGIDARAIGDKVA